MELNMGFIVFLMIVLALFFLVLMVANGWKLVVGKVIGDKMEVVPMSEIFDTIKRIFTKKG